MVFDKRIFDYINPSEMEHLALKRLVKKDQLTLYKHHGFWFAIDTYKELEVLNKIWNAGNSPWKVW